MENRTIYFNRKKAFLQIILGIAIIATMFLRFNSLLALVQFFVGGSFVYFGLKSVSGKPQIILKDDGLFVGFKFNKTISWKNIEKVRVIEKKVDYRSLKFLEITIRIKSNGNINRMIKEYMIENLEVSPEGIEVLIQERLKYVVLV
jgi:hypothetical protein